ncbi:MAG TPA: TetR/AcrR family transcriptional regulator [Xanthomonadaceae bacterium]|jgi:AcrR family transcriptional regulator|nr:TetR/AcrR family transcriptional regulator [Xanthomonadaceae bacterium]
MTTTKASAETTADAIASAARTIFEVEGPTGISMRRVAEAVGITPMAIYRHFPNREALLHRLSDDTFAEVTNLWTAKKKSTDVVKRLIELQDGYLDYASAHPHMFDYAYSVRREGARHFPKDFRARRSPTLNLIADTLEEGMRDGVFRKDDIWEAAMAIWGLAHGLICLYRAGRFSYSERAFRTFYHASIKRLLDGLKV